MAAEDSPREHDLEPMPAAATAIFGPAVEKAQEFAHLLATAGIERGLIGPREAPILWSRHILNCAVLQEEIPHDVRVVDIGSGAGLPGIPLALARPDLHIDLVEPLLRRATFLEECVTKLELDRVRVFRGRAEEVVADVGDADIVTARAVAPLGRLAGWSSPLLRIGGKLVALKGRSAAEEIDRDRDECTLAGFSDFSVKLVGESMLTEPTTVVVATKSTTPSVSPSTGAKPKTRRKPKRNGQR